MALINSKNLYIKLDTDGNYEVYASEEARARVKQSTSCEVILAKYEELLGELLKQEELKYYDTEGFNAKYNPLYEEFCRYCRNLTKHITGQEYPIIAKIYPDVADSIPEIVEGGKVVLSSSSQEEAYLKAKQLKLFGETIDA